MQIRGTSNINTTSPINLTAKPQAVERQSVAAQIDTADQIEISNEAQMAAQLHETSGIRSERVAEIRDQIATGQYETAEKLEQAVERMLDEIA